MPLVNRAPLDATGKLMVTTTTPTAAWPALGGMTYHPTTGELAVIDAVPGVNDPWNGGFRFTNLGSMYVTTVLPAPIFYVGGLPVSADGRMFMSSGAPIGSVGGWPIAGDGGIAGVGLAAVPIFFAPLMTTLVPTKAGNPTFTFARAALAYAMDFEGILRQSIANEARFQGARRVRNWLAFSEDCSNAAWTKANATIGAGVTDPLGGTTATTLTNNGGGLLQCYQNLALPAGSSRRFSAWVRRRTGTGGVSFYVGDSAAGAQSIAATLTSTWQRITLVVVTEASGNCYAGFAVTTAADAIDIWHPQFEDVSGQSNQAPSDYVSVGVLAAPYHGNAVDGVKYFATTNGNSVAANVVTEATGTPIPLATTLGYVAENAATNTCLQSQAFDNATWNKNDATITPNTQAAPDGTLTADTFTDDATNAFHRIIQAFNATVGSPVTLSLYLKAGTLTWVQFYASDGAPQRYANFNLVTGAIGSKEAGTTAVITPLPNGWYRCSISYTVNTVSSNFQIFSMLSDVPAPGNPTYVGTGQTMYLWGAQVEQASDPSSYIPTTTVAVSRAGDLLSYQSATNINGALGTAYSEVYPFANPAVSQISIFWSPSYVQYYETTRALGLYNGAAPINTVNTRIQQAINKNATAWNGATASVCLNGGAVATGASVALGSAANILIPNSGYAPQGTIRNVKFYATRLTDAELIAMTT